MTNGSSYRPEDLLPFAVVCAELHPTPAKLRRMARRGQFPPLLRVTTRHQLVRRADLEAWKAGRWTVAEQVRAASVVEAVLGGVVNRRRRSRTA